MGVSSCGSLMPAASGGNFVLAIANWGGILGCCSEFRGGCSLEVRDSLYGDGNPFHGDWPLLRGMSLFGRPLFGGSTVYRVVCYSHQYYHL